MWYVYDVLYSVLYVRVTCFVVRGYAVSRRYIYVCNCDMFSVVNMYLDHFKFRFSSDHNTHQHAHCHHNFYNIILMTDKHNIPKGKMHSNCRLLPDHIVCTKKQHKERKHP